MTEELKRALMDKYGSDGTDFKLLPLYIMADAKKRLLSYKRYKPCLDSDSELEKLIDSMVYDIEGFILKYRDCYARKKTNKGKK